MLNRLVNITALRFGSQKPNKPKSVRQRIKYYSRYPDKYRLKTRIRPPNLTDPQLTFPIKIPIRYRHQFHLNKELFIDNSSKIHWNRLQPNQILLAFENPQYLSFEEVTEGLKTLSGVKGQEQHNWNEHEWVSNAMNRIRDDFGRIKKVDIMNYYYLMKKLNYSDADFWKKMYQKINDNLYDIPGHHFEDLLIRYYDVIEEKFDEEARPKFQKLMQGRIRTFKASSIVTIFQKYMQEKRIDNYWLENVFATLFKSNQYKYTPEQVGKIFRFMIIMNHEENDRLYASLYKRILTMDFKTVEEVEELEGVLLEVKELFTSHRVDPCLEHLENKKQQIKENPVETKKTIQQMVKDDLKYFLQKRKLKEQNYGQN